MHFEDVQSHNQIKSSDINPENVAPDQENAGSDGDNFIVCVRVRPLHSRETSKKNPKKQAHLIKLQDNMVIVMDPDISTESTYKREKMYVFDNVFSEDNDTNYVCRQTMLPLLDNVVNGYNATLFAYGMTGAGKTHTLFGELDPETLRVAKPGLIFLTLEELFAKTQSPTFADYEFSIKVSYLEIYNEQVRDLLKGDDQNLMILEDPQRGVLVADLLESSVSSLSEVMQLIMTGNSKRTMASTSANTFSSRSHAIVQVLVERKERAAGLKGVVLQSKLSLIDLAGSERAAVTENRGIRMLEGANINRSLLALGNCINILSDSQKKGAFVPYRDSKLTRLLKDSLGGNTKTIMIACVSPSYLCYEETVNTLKYASRAKNIKRKLHQNVKEVELHVSQYKEIIENLKAEIDSLKGQLKVKNTEESFIPSNQNNEAPSPQSLESSKALEEEKRIDQASHKIFENLEQNWEINQTLRELNELELQNKDTLQNLYQHLEHVSEEDRVYREQILRQIETLKTTMDSNERIKRETANTLQGNLLENRNLKEQLIEFASSVDTLEDIELAKKLLDIDRLDMMTQNTEIKKQALNLAKARVQQNKQISQMEEEMRQMKAMLYEKERLLASNHSLIQDLRTQIIEQAAPVQEPIKETKQERNSHSVLSQVLQGIDGGNGEKLEHKTTALKSLLINLEKKITLSLNELDSKIPSSHDRDLDEQGAVDNIEILEGQSSGRKDYESEKVKTYNEYSRERNERKTKHSENNSLALGTLEDLKSRRFMNKENHLLNNSARVDKRTNDSNVALDSQTSFQQDALRTPSDMLQKINIYDRSNLSNRSRVVANHDILPVASTTPQDPRFRLAFKGFSTGGFESSERFDTTQNTESTLNAMNPANFADVDDPHHVGTISNIENSGIIVHTEVLDPLSRMSGQYQSQELLSSAEREDMKLLQSSLKNNEATTSNNNHPATKGFEQFFQSNYIAKQSSTKKDAEDPEHNPRRHSFHKVAKSKTRDHSLGNIKPSLIHGQPLNREHNKHSNSILGIYREKFFESIAPTDTGAHNDSLNIDRRALEIKSLGQEREHLKVFRNKLNILSGVNVTKLNKETADQIRELIDEFKVKKYILAVKDQDCLRMLGEALAKHERKESETTTVHKRKGSFKEDKKARSSSVRGSQNLAASKDNKARGYNQRNKERKLSMQRKYSEGEDVVPKRSSVRSVIGQGVLSNLHSNYAQTLNKIVAPAYTGRPEGLLKSKSNQSNPQTPIPRKALKEKENITIEPKKSGTNLLNIFESQPKYISNAIKRREMREANGNQSRFNEGDKVNV